MRIAAALILTLASSVVVAEQPHVGYQVVMKSGSDELTLENFAHQPQQQPSQGDSTDGVDASRRAAPDSIGFIYDGDGDPYWVRRVEDADGGAIWW